MDEKMRKLKVILKKHLPKLDSVELNPEVALADLGIDSLGAVELVFDIENDFDVEITDEMMARMKTVGDVLRCVDIQPSSQPTPAPLVEIGTSS